MKSNAWIYGGSAIDDAMPSRLERSHRGRTPLGEDPPSQTFNRIVRTENETRAFEKRVAKRRAKNRKKS